MVENQPVSASARISSTQFVRRCRVDENKHTTWEARMSEESQNEQEPREHTEQPAEGDRSSDPADTGTHSQDPAEGPDSEAKTSRTAGDH